jgi:hypothetical protein
LSPLPKVESAITVILTITGVSDAIAEFVDNSIQACRDNTESRKIEVSLELSDDSPCFITVIDDGVGMNADAIKTFATFAYGQEARTDAVSSSNTSNISKFGVGAKQAGFYLGDRIHVVTRPRGSDPTKNQIMDFVMSVEGFKQRHEANAYTDNIFIMEEGSESPLWLPDYPTRLLELKRRLEASEAEGGELHHDDHSPAFKVHSPTDLR